MVEGLAGMGTVITDLDQMPAVESEWRRLAELRGNAFLTPEWFRCWHCHYGEEALPFVTTASDPDGRLLGLLPLALSRSGRPRTCWLAGANLGDDFHPVCEAGDEPAVARAAGRALASAPLPWSVLVLDNVEDRSPGWVADLVASTGVHLRRWDRPPVSLPMIELRRYSGYEGYLASRSRNLRSQTRRKLRRAEERHAVRLRRTEGPETLPGDLDALFHLHDLRFAGRSSLSGERTRRFHRDFAAEALERGWLRLWLLEFDGVPVAAEYGWRVGRRYSYFNGGFDPGFSALSPGMIMRAKVLEAVFDEGADEFDFLLGDEQYKLRYADNARSVRSATLARAHHPASVITSTEHGIRRLGRMVPEGARRRFPLDRLGRRLLLKGRAR